MKRVLVIGSCGAGKSTFARRLHEITGLKLIHLDSFYHLPNWGEPSKEDWLKLVQELIKGDEWIIDGNYGGSMEMRLERCDTVIWLNFPRTVCTWRVLKRIWLYRKGGRPDMAEGCEERFDWEFIKYVWNFPRDKNPKIVSRLAKFPDKKVFHLKSNNEIEKFFVGVSGRD
jgi:adenylate kinase family enzyme